MSLLYAPNFKYPEGDLRKNQEFMDSSHHYHQQDDHQHHHHHQQQQQQHNSGLTRYRSAPSSFLEGLVNGNNGSSGGNCEDYRYFRPSSPEIDNFLEKYMLPCNGSGDSGGGGARDLQDFGGKSVKQEEAEPMTRQNGYSNGSSQIVYQTLPVHTLANDNLVSVGNAMDNSFSVVSSMAMDNSVQEKMATGNSSNLRRQNSSPAGVFSNLGVDNGFACNGTNGEASPSTGRLHNHLSFSSGLSSRLIPPTTDFGNLNMGTGDPERSLGGNNCSSTLYMSSLPRDSWDNTSFNGVKRVRENDGNMFFGLSTMETQSARLAHHLSLPKTSAEMAVVEKFLHFQGSVPCKIRAKRGFATHPRSIAERMRRTRISERIRKLQDLFPNMDKQTNTADMLEMAVEYIKDLQKQVKTLTDNKAKCRCPSKQKQY